MGSILTVNTQDHGGGAAKIACTLMEGYAKRGRVSQMAVGIKRTRHPEIHAIRNDRGQSGLSAFFWKHRNRFKNRQHDMRGAWAMTQILEYLASPGRRLDRKQGREILEFPGSYHLAQQVPKPVDLYHLHNLHGDYFDLRALSTLSGDKPTIITLHDAWLMAGHCSHPFDCDRWLLGCGQCPDLTIPPAIEKDATAQNWEEKRRIFSQSKLYVACPSRYMLDKAKRSILSEGMIEGRVIRNGIDLSVFHPGDKEEARKKLSIDPNAKVVVFAAHGTKNSAWRDFPLMRKAVESAASELEQGALFLAIGEDAPSEHLQNSEIRYIPYLDNPGDLADYYRACDVYIHAAKAETFSLTTVEAMACGASVVATALGALPEVVDDETTGFLTPAGDLETYTGRIVQLLTDKKLAVNMGRAGAEKAKKTYDENSMVDQYLSWFNEIEFNSKENPSKK